MSKTFRDKILTKTCGRHNSRKLRRASIDRMKARRINESNYEDSFMLKERKPEYPNYCSPFVNFSYLSKLMYKFIGKHYTEFIDYLNKKDYKRFLKSSPYSAVYVKHILAVINSEAIFSKYRIDEDGIIRDNIFVFYIS